MCLAIVKPKGVQIARKYLQNGYDGNGDGCGFALATGHRLEVYRGFETFEHLWTTLKPVQHRYTMLIHFRLATHGEKNVANMHPFLICDGRYAVIHNGVLNIKSKHGRSDTAIFAEDVLQPLLKRGISFNDPAFRYLVETSIGSGNKVCIIRADGKTAIYNESQGHWHKGAWYSNHGYCERHWWQSWPESNTVKDYWKRLYHPKQGQSWSAPVVFDDEGVPDAESSNRLAFPDYDGQSAHQKLIES